MPYTGYDPRNYDPNKRPEYDSIPVGDYRVRIAKADYHISKNSGKESIKIEFDVSGMKNHLWLYIGCQPEDQEQKVKLDQRLGELFDAFNMQPTMNLPAWVGKVGGVHVKHEDYNGEKSAKVAYILRRDKTDLLPPWQNPGDAPHPAFAGPDTTTFSVPFNNAQPQTQPQSYRNTSNPGGPYGDGIPF